MKLVTIIDGDTFIALDQRGVKRKLRLRGVDCPEMGQRNSVEAKTFVQGLTHRKWVRVRLRGRDKYSRHVADVFVGGKSLARLLVAQGMGYPLGSDWGLRVAAAGARTARRGVYSGGGQAKPWTSFSRTWLGRTLKGRPARRIRR